MRCIYRGAYSSGGVVMSATEKYEVRNRFTGKVQFTAKITTTPEMLPSVKLGLAVRWARNSGAYLNGAYLRGADLNGANLNGANLSGVNLNGANLRGADLSGADLNCAYLNGANLSGADLSGVNLNGAYLSGANLNGAYLRSIEADFRYILSRAHNEVPALIAALKDGRVDGSTYTGECACLVGTLENAGAEELPHEGSSPAESWFVPITKGTKPGDDSEGGFRAAKALEWAESYCRDTGINLTEQVPA